MHTIAMDTHCTFTEYCIMSASGRIGRQGSCATAIPDLVEIIQTVPRPRHVVFEEGPLADWLIRNLRPHADQVISCNPRRNHLIARDGDKDDPIDAPKLGHLYRGGFIKTVHHSESQARSIFKQHVGLYHNRVANRVRLANRILAESRRQGVFIEEADLASADRRREWWKRLPSHRVLREDLKLLLAEYDLAAAHNERLKRTLVRLGKQEEVVRRFVELPGIRWIRASTFYVYVDTPWRFRSKSALWRYMGIGLQRRHSGNGPERVRVPPAVEVCRPLKSMILGAAKSAIAAGDNPFAEQHRQWENRGVTPRNARRNVARSLAAVMWGMRKNGSAYRPEWVGVAWAALCGQTPSKLGG